jgi:3-oxoacyl-[acyl-carrier protein] reductase
MTSRIVIITGGGTGIGKETARQFAAQGDHVVLLGRRSHMLRQAAGEIGSDAEWHETDVSRRDQVQATIQQIVNHWNRIDVLVNAAGFSRGVAATMPMEEAEPLWDEVIDTVLKGSFLMAMGVAPHLPRPGGRIIMISSIAAYSGGSRGGAIEYAAAKAGMHGLTMGLARDLAPAGITVNAIAPGFIAQTGFTGQWSAERVAAITAQTPLGRAGQAEDIAAAARYLASAEASFITGEILNVNGGWMFGR